MVRGAVFGKFSCELVPILILGDYSFLLVVVYLYFWNASFRFFFDDAWCDLLVFVEVMDFIVGGIILCDSAAHASCNDRRHQLLLFLFWRDSVFLFCN